MTSARIVALFAMLALLIPGVARSEKADREKEIDMSAKQATVEGSNQNNIKKLEGDVLITQGTMRITADRAIVKETDGDKFAELFGNSASQITFRQKREGENDYMEASADRAEYDERSETIRLFSRVRFKSAGDVVDSEYMQYNTNSEKMELRNQIPGVKTKASTEEGRVVFKVQPRSSAASQPNDGKSAPRKTN
ncbi:MAG: lipopolysaccharide transport periplasmic protein LptA [Betaproteobacteria bacterium]